MRLMERQSRTCEVSGASRLSDVTSKFRALVPMLFLMGAASPLSDVWEIARGTGRNVRPALQERLLTPSPEGASYSEVGGDAAHDSRPGRRRYALVPEWGHQAGSGTPRRHPVTLRKARVKWLWSANPSARLTSAIEISGSRICSQAALHASDAIFLRSLLHALRKTRDKCTGELLLPA